MTPSRLELGQLVVGDAEAAQHRRRCARRAAERGARWNALGAAGEPDRQRAVPRRARDGVVDVLEEAAGLQLRQRRLLVRLHHLGDRARPPPRGARRCRRRSARRTSSTGGRRWRRAASRRPPRSRAPGPSPTRARRARRAGPATARRSATAIATHASRPPSSSASAARYRFCGGRSGSAVAVPLEQGAVGGVLDDLLGGDVQRRVDHRRLDQHALAGAPAVLEREEQAAQRRGCRRWGRPRSRARRGFGRGSRSAT